MTPRVVWLILAALPGVILAAVGLTHPHDLDPTTAEYPARSAAAEAVLALAHDQDQGGDQE